MQAKHVDETDERKNPDTQALHTNDESHELQGKGQLLQVKESGEREKFGEHCKQLVLFEQDKQFEMQGEQALESKKNPVEHCVHIYALEQVLQFAEQLEHEFPNKK